MNNWFIMSVAAVLLLEAGATFARNPGNEPLLPGRLGGIEDRVFNAFFLDRRVDNPEKAYFLRYALYAEPHEFTGFLKGHFEQGATNGVSPAWYVEMACAASQGESRLCRVETNGNVVLEWNRHSYRGNDLLPAHNLGEAERRVVNWLTLQYGIATPRQDLCVRFAMYAKPQEFAEGLLPYLDGEMVVTNDVCPKWYIGAVSMKPPKSTYLCSVDRDGKVSLEWVQAENDVKCSDSSPTQVVSEFQLGDQTRLVWVNDQVCCTESNYETALHRRLTAQPVSNGLWRVDYAFQVVERSTLGARAYILASHRESCQIARDRLFETLRLNLRAKRLGEKSFDNSYSGLLAIFNQEQGEDVLTGYDILRPSSLTDLWYGVLEQAEGTSAGHRDR
jgi:hypothetical protein